MLATVTPVTVIRVRALKERSTEGQTPTIVLIFERKAMAIARAHSSDTKDITPVVLYKRLGTRTKSTVKAEPRNPRKKFLPVSPNAPDRRLRGL